MKPKLSCRAKRGSLLRGVLMAAVVAACGICWRPSAARADVPPAAAGSARPRPVAVPAKAPARPPSLDEVYAAREAGAEHLTRFEGGGQVVVGSTLVVVLLIVLIIILL